MIRAFKIIGTLFVVLFAAGMLAGCTMSPATSAAPPAPGEMLMEGDTAPDFRLVNQNGEAVELSEHMGAKNVLLIFYPGDMTPGCTKQLCEARDSYPRLQNSNTVVFGINPADADSHFQFAADYDFPFDLLVDEDNDVARKYGALSPEGRIARTVYLIDKQGDIVYAKRGMPTTAEILASANVN